MKYLNMETLSVTRGHFDRFFGGDGLWGRFFYDRIVYHPRSWRACVSSLPGRLLSGDVVDLERAAVVLGICVKEL